MHEQERGARHVEAVMTGGGGLRSLLIAKTTTAGGDPGGNDDGPMSQEVKMSFSYTVNKISDLQRPDFLRVVIVIVTPRL